MYKYNEMIKQTHIYRAIKMKYLNNKDKHKIAKAMYHLSFWR